MPLKSIVDLEIDKDGAFEKFKKSFNDFEQQVKKVKTESASIGATFSGLTAAVSNGWEKLNHNAKSFAGHIKSATIDLLRWSTVTAAVSGLLGGGGLFGIERLAYAAGNQRRASLGLGVSPGQQRAFEVNYGRIIDPSSFLGGVNESLHDVTKRVGLYGAGLNESQIRGRDTASVAADLVPALKKIADQTPENMLAQVLRARHLDQFILLEDFQRLRNTSAAEIGGYRRSYDNDIRALNLSREQQKAWQDLQVQLGRAGSTIEATFIRGLTPLAPKLSKLSDTFTHLVATLLKQDGPVSHWIDALAEGLEWLDKKIAAPSFQKDVEDFLTGIGEMGRAIGATVLWIKGFLTGNTPGGPGSGSQNPAPTPPGETAPEGGGWGFNPHTYRWEYQGGTSKDPDPAPPSTVPNRGGQIFNPNTRRWEYAHPAAFHPGEPGGGFGNASIGPVGDRETEAHDFFRRAGWSEAQTDGLLSYINGESRFKTDAFNPAGGGQGAQGIGQWRGPRIDAFRKMFGHDPREGTFQEQLMFMQWELTHSEKQAGDILRNIGTAGQAGAAVTHYYGRPGAVEGPGLETQRSRTAEQYGSQFKDRSVSVKIQNNTGGNANVSIATLAT